MAIKYTTKTNDKTKQNPADVSYQIIFFALNFLAVPFSAWQTYKGYRDVAAGDNELEKLIFPALLALISAVLFFGLNYLIMDLRKNGKPHFIQTLGYIIPLGISFFGNFNSFYSNQMKASLLSTEITQYQDTLRITYSNSKDVLIKSTGLNELKNDLENELTGLTSSYNGESGASGWFNDCNEYWKKIEYLLGESEIKLFNKIPSVARNTVNSKFATIESSRKLVVNPVLNKIDSHYSEVSELIADAKVNNELSIQGNFILDQIRIANNDIGSSTKSFLTSLAYNKNEDFYYTQLTQSKETQIGTIKHTLNSAFIKWDEPTATVFALFFSIIIDLAVLIFIFLAFSYNNKRRPTYQGPRPL